VIARISGVPVEELLPLGSGTGGVWTAARLLTRRLTARAGVRRPAARRRAPE
jgi:hypothetical protein